MMICPACRARNIDGVDQCTECLTDLRQLDAPSGRSPFEQAMLNDPIVNLIPRDPLKVTADTSIRDAVARLIETGRNCALVVDDGGGMVGIFTERDILMRLSEDYPALADRPVSEFMTPDPVRLRPTDSIAFGLNQMMVGNYRHLPIERDGQALGVVSVRHILGYIETCRPEVVGAAD